MQKFFYAFGLTSALMFALAEQSTVPNFAGTWTLDKSQSQSLGQHYTIHERASWVITQTNKEISIAETFKGFAKADEDLRPVPLSTGGGSEPLGPSVYKLNGSETTTRKGRIKFARKIVLSTDGKTLELIERMTIQGEREVTSTSSDKLSLSADGKLLTVIRQTDGSRGPRDSILVFNR